MSANKSKGKPALVHFLPLCSGENADSLAKKTKHLLHKSGFLDIIAPKHLMAVKQHFGEAGNAGYLPPRITKAVVDLIKQRGGLPLLVETNTLYRGKRSNSYHHLLLAREHGFSIETMGVPIVMMDGVNGQNQHSVKIPGKHFDSVNLASDLPFFHSLFVLSHFKGHMASGMAGAVKNLAMGFSSRAGKLAQHADFRPEINSLKCSRCGLCRKFCPANALTLGANSMETDWSRCLGCGECYVACGSDAISFHWGRVDALFQEKMAEHALGAIINHKNNSVFLNFLRHVSKNCDCWSGENPPLYPDIGIFASSDPIAVDRACYDMAHEVYGKDVFREFWPEIDPLVQLRHGERIGLGSQDYEIIELEV